MSPAHDHRAGVPFCYDHPRPAVTVDSVVFTMRAEDLAVLLIKRKSPPFKGRWALPGGFVNAHEPLDRAALRELEEETGIRDVPLEQLGAFGDPGRDPRGHTVSIAYFAFCVAELHPVRAGDDAADARWIPLHDLALPGATDAKYKLAFDHDRIIVRARDALRQRLNDPTRLLSMEIVPPRFTLTELQRVYEAVFARALDKRNFRARLLAHKLVEPVAEARRTGRHRPAQLFRWRVARGRR